MRLLVIERVILREEPLRKERITTRTTGSRGVDPALRSICSPLSLLLLLFPLFFLFLLLFYYALDAFVDQLGPGLMVVGQTLWCSLQEIARLTEAERECSAASYLVDLPAFGSHLFQKCWRSEVLVIACS